MPARNLVFLVDVLGSIQDANKLPLLKESIGLLAEELDERDAVSIVVYAGASGVALPPMPAAIACCAVGQDPYGYRRERVELVAYAQELYEP